MTDTRPTPVDDLPTAYDPAGVEQRLYADWESSGLFHAEPDDPGEPFAIVLPPPNVTGALHVGHALYITEDAMVRHARMTGHNAVWVPGMDHAGISTQTVVERELATEGLTRHDLGRDAFIERVWAWVEEYGGQILNQLRRLGFSLDWEREAFTFDEPRSRAVTEVFVTLHEQGLLYRGNRLISWCPQCMTALSDIEVDHVETAGTLTRFVYPWVDQEPGRDGVTGIAVATTRPETMLGDTAIAVHPDDERYASVVGRTVRHPFLDRTIPVIADDWVDPEFGSGAVKITPAHDPNDFAMAERHDLPAISVIDPDATMNGEAGRFAGMDRFDAREAVVTALDESGLLLDREDYTHQVGTCSRTGDVVEPLLSDQWFLEVRPLADKALAAVEAGDTRVLPPRLQKFFVEWLENLHDWCVSRQIWWGHRIPAWYCGDDHVTVARDTPDACRECGSTDLRQDDDVLDTWFSSQLWPFTVFGWEKPGDVTPELQTWYPNSVLETGYDINTFWVSRMLQIGLWFLDDVPFTTIWNHGLVRDGQGKKMSKSFGNVIDPLEFIESHGADALRLALFQHCSPGTDVPLSPDWVEGARRFLNKLFNTIRFALLNLDGTTPGELPDDAELGLADRWILSRLEVARAAVDDAYGPWDWARMSTALYHFTWDELADWYLEAAKVVLYGDDEDAKSTTRAVLARVLDDLLRLWHPLIPFVTEELWRHLTGATGGRDSLMVQEWPSARTTVDPDVEAEFAVVVDLVTEVRRFRSLNDVAPSRRFPLVVSSTRADLLSDHVDLVTALAGLESISFVEEITERPGTSTIVFGAGEAQVELAGLIDVAAERARLERELDTARGLLERSRAKLANEQFVARAPADVVAAERDREASQERSIAELRRQVDALDELL
ncbi:valine--tRNA ligase [Salsipaludibacter albus]|uniref:valine--tRNA ligase n=1 Tax=Salsipaludibacter albus TaxID=2849650 RepID=UPI001EE3A4CD|nr:valine--tRNA ligase [Salsipaludibacter albus]MBY5162745.1 valine--tRNA ligase [Salsipaludibacter albus]